MNQSPVANDIYAKRDSSSHCHYVLAHMRASVCCQSVSIVPQGRKKAVALLPLIRTLCG